MAIYSYGVDSRPCPAVATPGPIQSWPYIVMASIAPMPRRGDAGTCGARRSASTSALEISPSPSVSSDFRTASISPVLHRPSDGPFDRHGSDGAPDGSATPSSSAQTRATSDDGAFDGGAFDGGAFDGTLADGAFDGGTLDGGVLGAAFDGGVFDGAFGASADATDDSAAAEGPCVSAITNTP